MEFLPLSLAKWELPREQAGFRGGQLANMQCHTY